MQDNILTPYKNVNEKILVPDQLKEDTIRLMKERKPVRKYTAFAYAAAVFAGIVVLGVVSLQIRQRAEKDITICDALDENSVKEQVALSKGSLDFEKIPGEFAAPGLTLGVMDGQKVSVNEKEYFAYLGKNPLPSYIPEGMTKQETEGQMLTQKEDGSYGEDLFSVTYEGSNESFLEILLSANGIPEAEMAKELTGSLINGIEIKTAYYGAKPEETVFLAYLQEEGVGYRIKSRGISQEEFIRILLSIINK